MNFNSFSIRIKLILLLSLSAAIALFISSIIFFYYTYNLEKKSYIESLTQLSMISSENIKPAIMFMDEESANKIIAPFKINENILSAKVYDESFTQFASYTSNSYKLDSSDIEIIPNYKDKFVKNKEIIKVINWDRVIVLVPIILDNQFIGIFEVISNTNLLKEKLINLTIIQTIIIIFTLVLIIYLSTKVEKIFTEPMFKLVDIMNYISKSKKYDTKINLNRFDEFRDLNDGFNSMIKEINTRDKEMKEMHTKVTDSIEYASLIQHTLMPKSEDFKHYFRDFFIIWQPRNIVGGDIYLFEELPNDKGCLLLVIDCTGHGVPGAFVTMLVKAIEREVVSKIINSNNEVNTAEILSIFNKSIKYLLKQDSRESISNAGFDGGVLYYNKKKNIVKFSGAKTPLFFIQNNKINMIKGCRHSIGYKRSDVNYKFQEHTINVSNDTYIYLTTDGYLDQIGGERNYIFGKKRFQKLLRENFKKPFDAQKKILKDTLADYSTDNLQTDDITLLGLKI